MSLNIHWGSYSDDRPHYIIMGARKGVIGCGLINDLQYVSQRTEALKAVLQWRITMPDWNFSLDNLRGMTHKQVSALYDRDLNGGTHGITPVSEGLIGGSGTEEREVPYLY